MSPSFIPAPVAESAVDERARAAGDAAGWAAGSRAAAQAAAERAAAVEAENRRAEQRRDTELARALAVLDRAAQSLDARSVPVLENLTTAVHSAALAIAEAVLGAELADGERSARAALERVLRAGAPVHTVRMHPGDVELLRAVPLPPGVRLLPDPGLAAGDAVAEHAEGEVDAVLAHALDRVRTVLLGEL